MLLLLLLPSALNVPVAMSSGFIINSSHSCNCVSVSPFCSEMYLNNDESTSGTLPRRRRRPFDDGDAVDTSVEAAEAAAVAAFRVDGVNDDDDGPLEEEEEEVGGFIGSLLCCGCCDGESFFPPGGCGVNAASELSADVNNNETEKVHETDASNVTVVIRRAAAVVENTAAVADVVAGGVAVHDDDEEDEDDDDSDRTDECGDGNGNADKAGDDEDRDPSLRLLSLLDILILLDRSIDLLLVNQ
mmetsp:Transcript_42089/g.101204  ORF Transcript_42089/g.101204 Transcript_42089/m.101204 type:complete len:244 (-) Transcript_42089:288-1019(-)